MLRTSLTAMVCGALLAGSAAAAVNDANRKKMEEACPTEAPAKAAKPHKVLIYSHCNGFVHRGAIEHAKVVLHMMGEKTGAYTAVVSDDLSNFEADKIKEFDAIILSNTTGELFQARAPRKPRKPNPKRAKNQEQLKKAMAKYEKQMEEWKKKKEAFDKAPKPDTEQLRKSFMDWIKAGGGVVGIHAATDCSYKWKEYGEMMGGYFAGHPWHMKVHIKNDDPENPVNACLDGKGFVITDEIYQFNRGVYSRDKLRVLLSLDIGEGKTPDKGKREDDDYAVSWLNTHGKGRIYYNSLGHRDEIFWNPTVLKHYLAGIQWVLGDLEGVDATPKPLAAK